MKASLQKSNDIFSNIQDLKSKKTKLNETIKNEYDNLISILSQELNIKVGDKVYLNQYEKEVVISKFDISYSSRYSHADSFKEYLTDEEYTIHTARRYALWAECYEVNKNGKVNKKTLPEYNRFCLEDIKTSTTKIEIKDTRLEVELRDLNTLKYEYEDIFIEICEFLKIDSELDDLDELSNTDIENIYKTLKFNFRSIWKEL